MPHTPEAEKPEQSDAKRRTQIAQLRAICKHKVRGFSI
jgi:hypothetical protein